MPVTVTGAGNGPVDNEVELGDLFTNLTWNAQTSTSWGVYSPGEFGIVFTGTSFSGYSGNHPTSGTITSLTMYDLTSGTLQGDTWSGLSIDMAAFIAFETAGDSAGFANAVFGGNDTITGSAFADNLWGYGGSDTMTPTSGAAGDYVNAGAGNDLIFSSGMQIGDTYDGGADLDGLYVSGGSVFNEGDSDLNGFMAADYSTGTLLNIEYVSFNVSSPVNQIAYFHFNQFGVGMLPLALNIQASSASNIVWIYANPGGVNLAGLSFGNGWNPLVAGSFEVGHDVVVVEGSTVADTLTGSSTGDRLEGGLGNDILQGNNGDDSLTGGAGQDQLQGGAGDDFLEVAASEFVAGDSFDGGADTDLLYAVFDSSQTLDLTTATISNIEGFEFDSSGNSVTFLVATVSATQAASFTSTFSLAGSEVGIADIFVISASSAATLNLSGWQLILGWGATDRVAFVGSTGNDSVTGTTGVESLYGGAGVDTLNGYDGDDFIIASEGLSGETYNGGGGTDALIVERSLSTIGSGTFTGLYLEDYSAATVTSIERLNFGNPLGGLPNQNAHKLARFTSDQLGTGLVSSLAVFGVSGRSDVVEIISSGAGTIDLTGWTFGTWTTQTSAGFTLNNDLIHVIGGSGAETVLGSSQADYIEGGGGDDYAQGGGGHDYIDGGAGAGDYAGYGGVASTNATWTRNTDGSWTVTSANGTDRVTNVEYLDFSDRDVFLDRAVHNFSGDGTSDILLRRISDGVTAIWTMNGSTVTGSDVTQWQAGSEWTIQGIGDFGGDGRDDFLLRRNADGVTAIWSMNGTAVVASDVTQWQAGLEWVIQGIGDFNSDGHDDILWRRASDGVTSIWQLNGTAVVAADVTEWQAGNEWVISGIGDFNGDGNDDFLWRRQSDGVMSIWNMDGTDVLSADVTSQQAGLTWGVEGVGDFNGDGRDDLLIRNTDGVTAIWYMNGTTVSAANLTTAQAGNDWSIAAVGDYNGDGRDDILISHSSGVTAVWVMNGFTVVSSDLTSQQAGSDWGYI